MTNIEKTIDDLVQNLKPVQVMRTSSLVLAVSILSFVCAFGMLMMMGPRAGLFGGENMLPFFWKAGTFGLFIAALTRVLIEITIPGRPTDNFAGVILGMALFALFLPIGYQFFQHPDQVTLQSAIHATAQSCIVGVTISGLISFSLFLFWIRKALPYHPRRSAFVAGLLSGAIGVFAYSFHCGQDHPLFVTIWYPIAAFIPGVLAFIIAGLALSGRNRQTP